MFAGLFRVLTRAVIRISVLFRVSLVQLSGFSSIIEWHTRSIFRFQLVYWVINFYSSSEFMICSYGCSLSRVKKEEGICEKIIQVWLMKDETSKETIQEWLMKYEIIQMWLMKDETIMWGNHSCVTDEGWNTRGNQSCVTDEG